ncbi:hypothetical protein M434DRAFT_18716 [Hypoxylon sp. CO27-5]|nr:hypothetical protein M434DRAFT_18716 [Hypoxylon sp. CO27-5]
MGEPPKTLQSFPQFRILPPELRQEIWSYCLPRRVVQMHDSRRRQRMQRFKREESRRRATPVIPGPPLISQVCRESRYVALRKGCFETMALYGTRAWFDRSGDVINVGRAFSTGAAIYDGRVVESGLQTIACSNPDIPLSIDADLVEKDGWDNRPPWGTRSKPSFGTLAEWVVKKLLPGRRTCAVVLRNVPIRTSYEEACASGLFGLLAEETTVHINVEDAKKMAALSDMYKRTTKAERWDAMQEYFSNREVDYDISWFLKCVKAMWLKEKGVMWRTLAPDRLTLGDEEVFKEELEQLPQFTYVIAAHLSVCTPG